MKKTCLVGLLALMLFACAQESPDYLSLAFDNNDSSYCAQVKEDHLRNWCYTDVAANLNNPTVCEPLEGEYRQNCIKNIAIANEDTSMCEQLTGLPKDRCYLDIALETQEANLCRQIETDLDNECYDTLARETTNYNLCLEIGDLQMYDACLLRVSLNAQEPNGCIPISSDKIKDLCYLNHAIQQEDYDMCEQAGQYVGACRQAIDNNLNRTETANATAVNQTV